METSVGQGRPAIRTPDQRIARIQADDTASYKSFSNPDELAGLLEADLATLLAERFEPRASPRLCPGATRASTTRPSSSRPSASRSPTPA